MKIALVSGANKGIGFATARRLGRSGAKVLVGARDDAKGAQACACPGTRSRPTSSARSA